MKKLLLILFLALIALGVMGQQILVDEDFENYNNGEHIAIQSSNFTTWNDNPGSVEDAFVSQDYASSGIQSIKIDGVSRNPLIDLFVPFDDYTTGYFGLDLNILIEQNNGGYFNMQKTSTPGEEWAFEIYFSQDGSGLFLARGDSITFDYPVGDWNSVAIDVDLNEGLASISINDDLIDSWDWTFNSRGIPGLNQVGGINLFAGAFGADNPLYYVDDLSATYSETSVAIEEIAPQSIGTIYPNPATNNITIALEDASSALLSIIDINGKVIMTRTLNNSLTNLNIENLEAGFYISKISHNGSYTTNWLIVH